MAAKAKTMAISKFKELHIKGLTGRQLQATLVSRRFGLPRNLLLAATSESMIEAWRTGKPAVLARRDGSKLTAPANGEACAEAREALKAVQTCLAKWAKAPATDRELRNLAARVVKALAAN